MIELTKENFDKEVIEETQTPVLVDFWGPKCGPCLALMPHIEKLAEEYGDKIKFCKLDTSKNRRLSISQKVMGLPTIIIYKNGEKAEELSGEVTEEKVEDLIKNHI